MAQQNQIKRVIELGVSQVGLNARDLGLALAAIAQEMAKTRVIAANETALTDSSTGVANGSNALAAVSTGTLTAVDEVLSMAPKAGFDTAIGIVEDAHAEIGAQINLMLDVINPHLQVADFSEAASTDQEIPAMTKALTGTAATNAAVDAQTGNAQIVIARNNQASLAAGVNYCRVAVGLAPITDNSGGTFIKNGTDDFPVEDQAATGSVAGSGDLSLLDSEVDAALDTLANNVASLAAALDEVVSIAAGDVNVSVVATMNPGFKFQPNTVQP